MKTPERVPEKGFYYHYKHDLARGVADYAYEVIGTGLHTEDDCDPRDQFMVAYLPLHEDARPYQLGKMLDLRPLKMFMEDVTKDGKTFPRFQKITDPTVIQKLEEIKKRMYS